MRRGPLLHLADEEVFGDDAGKGAGFSLDNRHGNPYLFGPKSTCKVKFPRGLRIGRPKIQRIGELVAEGKADYDIARIIMAEFPGKAPGWRVITKIRSVVEAEKGPTLCRCGRGINHVEDCDFKTPRVKRNRGLSVEAVRDIRANYGPQWTLIKLAHKWGCSESAVHAVVLNISHKAPAIKLAQYKVRMYLAQLEKLQHPVERLWEWRTLSAPDPGPESEFNARLESAREFLKQAEIALTEASRIPSGLTKSAIKL